MLAEAPKAWAAPSTRDESQGDSNICNYIHIYTQVSWVAVGGRKVVGGWVAEGQAGVSTSTLRAAALPGGASHHRNQGGGGRRGCRPGQLAGSVGSRAGPGSRVQAGGISGGSSWSRTSRGGSHARSGLLP